MAKKRVVPLWFNTVMKLVLRTPLLHSIVSDNIMLLTFTGCKSGKIYTIPVSYTQQGDAVMMFTNHIWGNNLVNNAPVKLHLRGHQLRAIAELNTDDVEQITPILYEHLRNKPADARIHHVTYDKSGNPVPAQVQQAAGNIRMIRFRLVS